MLILTIFAWLADAGILVYSAQMLARQSEGWSGSTTMIVLIVLSAAAIAVSAALVALVGAHWARLAALIVAGALPAIGGGAYLFVFVVTMLGHGRWN